MEDSETRKWIDKKWKLMLGYMPTVVRILEGWYRFHFLSQEDLEKIIAIPWIHGKKFLTLHKWYIGYNPLRNTPSNKLVWVKLPGLPLE